MFRYINLAVFFLVSLNLLGKADITNPFAALGLYYYVLIWLPGYYIVRRFFRNEEMDLIDIIPLAFCAGYAFFMPWTFLSYLVKLRLSVFIYAYSSIVLLFFIASEFIFKKPPARQLKKESKGVLLALAAALIGGFLLSEYFGGFISGNFLPHVSSIRKIFALDLIEQRSCYFPDLISHTNMYNIYYVFQAAVSKISGIDPVLIWIYLPQYIVPMGIIANFVFARRLSGSGSFAAFYIAFYFIYYLLYNPLPPAEGYAWFLSEQASCNNHIGEGIFMPVIMTLLFSCALPKKEGNSGKAALYFIPILLLTQGMIHMYVQAQTYFLIFTVLFWGFAMKPETLDYRAMVKPVVYSVIGLVYFAWIYIACSPSINPAFQVLNGTGGSLPVKIFGGWPVTDFTYMVFKQPAVIAATLAVLPAMLFARKNTVAFYVFAATFTIYFILYNPFVMKFGQLIHPPLERITRLFFVAPICMAVVFPAWLVIVKEKRPQWLEKLKYLILLATAVVVILLVKEAPGRLGKIVYTKEYSLAEYSRNSPLYKIINEAIPPGSVVLMNTPLTTWWTTYLPHYIVAHAIDCVISPNCDPTERKSDAGYFFANSLNGKSADILKKYGVEYVFMLDGEIKGKGIEKAAYLKPVTANRMFTIYKVAFDGVKK